MLFGVETNALAVVSPKGSWLKENTGYEPETLLTSQGIIYGSLHTFHFLLAIHLSAPYGYTVAAAGSAGVER